MGLLTAFIICLFIALLWQRQKLRELKNAHLNLAAEVGCVRRDSATAMENYHREIVKSFDHGLTSSACEVRDIRASVAGALDAADTYAKSLNERLVLLEIETTAIPKQPDEPPPVRRSFASQKARAEAGARMG